MQYSYLFFIVLLLAACNGTPSPQPSQPTSSQPILFRAPSNNAIVNSGEPIEVYLSVIKNQEFSAPTLRADNRAVRLVEVSDGAWVADPLDDALLTFASGEHTLTAYAQAQDGSTYTRTLTFYAQPQAPTTPVPANNIRITSTTIVNADSGAIYASFDQSNNGPLPAIPIEDLNNDGIEFQVDYEGDVYSMYFRSDALKKDQYLYGQDDFNFFINKDNGKYKFGGYTVYIEAYRSVGGDLIDPQVVSLRFLILDSELKINTRTIKHIQSLNRAAPFSADIVIENLGNRAGSYQFRELPDWLMLSRSEGSIEAGGKTTVIATIQACTQVSLEHATLKVSANGVDTEIQVTRDCVDGPLFDLSLDRFYFNQAVPANDSLNDPENPSIELVKNRMGIARAFVAASDDSDFGLPLVQLHYRTANGHTGSYDLVGPTIVPQNIYEGSLEQTFNTTLPAIFFEKGTEFYVVVDPNNEITERFENNNRYPSQGYMPLTIRDVPPLKLTLIPMVKSGSTKLPKLSEDSIPVLMQASMALMPLEDYDISIRKQPFVFTSTGWYGALSELNALRQAQNAEGLYFGIVQEEVDSSDTGGVARINGTAALGLPIPSVIAHELGHNFGLRHINCGNPIGIDLSYPHEDAQINLWGYSIFSGFLKEPASRDFMSYCGPEWISAYHYRKILLKRGGELFPATTATIQAQKTSAQRLDVEQELLMIGGAIDGALAQIHHVYHATGIAKPITASSPYALTLLNVDGAEIYSGKLDVDATSHGTQQLFTAKIPVGQLNAEIARVIIKYNDAVYLNQNWQPETGELLKHLHSNTVVSRLDAQRVAIQWQANGDTSLWVKDSQTGNVVAIDTTGEIIIFSQSTQLEFKYAQQGREQVEVVEVR